MKDNKLEPDKNVILLSDAKQNLKDKKEANRRVREAASKLTW